MGRRTSNVRAPTAAPCVVRATASKADDPAADPNLMDFTPQSRRGPVKVLFQIPMAVLRRPQTPSFIMIELLGGLGRANKLRRRRCSSDRPAPCSVVFRLHRRRSESWGQNTAGRLRFI